LIEENRTAIIFSMNLVPPKGAPPDIGRLNHMLLWLGVRCAKALVTAPTLQVLAGRRAPAERELYLSPMDRRSLFCNLERRRCCPARRLLPTLRRLPRPFPRRQRQQAAPDARRHLVVHFNQLVILIAAVKDHRLVSSGYTG
jgi:hypothetical protein